MRLTFLFVLLFSTNFLLSAGSEGERRGRIPEDRLEQLRVRLEANGGNLWYPTDPKFDNYTLPYNPLCTQVPGAVFLPNSVEDVRECLSLVQEFSAEFVITVSRANQDCMSNTDGYMINMRNFNKMEINEDKTEATFGAGVIINEAQEWIWTQGDDKFISTLSCWWASMTGPMFGGGIPWNNAMEVGTMADNVLSVEMMTYEGEVLTVNAENHPDLYWMIRNGGGEIGLILETTYRVHSNTGLNTWLIAFFDDYTEYNDEYFEFDKKVGRWLKTVPENCAVIYGWYVSYYIQVACTNGNAYEPFDAEFPADEYNYSIVSTHRDFAEDGLPIQEFIQRLSYDGTGDFLLYGQYEIQFYDERGNDRYRMDNRWVSWFADEYDETYTDLAAEWALKHEPSTSLGDVPPVVAVVFYHGGMHSIYDDSAKAYHGATVTYNLYDMTPGGGDDDIVRDFENMMPLIPGVRASYWNYRNPWTQKEYSFTYNLDRIESIRQEYDPEGVFAMPAQVGRDDIDLYCFAPYHCNHNGELATWPPNYIADGCECTCNDGYSGEMCEIAEETTEEPCVDNPEWTNGRGQDCATVYEAFRDLDRVCTSNGLLSNCCATCAMLEMRTTEAVEDYDLCPEGYMYDEMAMFTTGEGVEAACSNAARACARNEECDPMFFATTDCCVMEAEETTKEPSECACYGEIEMLVDTIREDLQTQLPAQLQELLPAGIESAFQDMGEELRASLTPIITEQIPDALIAMGTDIQETLSPLVTEQLPAAVEAAFRDMSSDLSESLIAELQPIFLQIQDFADMPNDLREALVAELQPIFLQIQDFAEMPADLQDALVEGLQPLFLQIQDFAEMPADLQEALTTSLQPIFLQIQDFADMPADLQEALVGSLEPVFLQLENFSNMPDDLKNALTENLADQFVPTSALQTIFENLEESLRTSMASTLAENYVSKEELSNMPAQMQEDLQNQLGSYFMAMADLEDLANLDVNLGSALAESLPNVFATKEEVESLSATVSMLEMDNNEVMTGMSDMASCMADIAGSMGSDDSSDDTPVETAAPTEYWETLGRLMESGPNKCSTSSSDRAFRLSFTTLDNCLKRCSDDSRCRYASTNFMAGSDPMYCIGCINLTQTADDWMAYEMLNNRRQLSSVKQLSEVERLRAENQRLRAELAEARRN